MLELQPLLFFDTAEGGGEHDRAGLVWDEVRLPDGRWDIEGAAATARYRCRHCGHEHPDDATTWAAFNDSGEYVCNTPERGGEVISVEWNALVDGHWAGLVREFLLADASLKLGAPLPMKKFRQKHLAQPWEDTMGEVTPDLPLGTYHKLDPWGDAPDAKRFLTVDYQAAAGGGALRAVDLALGRGRAEPPLGLRVHAGGVCAGFVHGRWRSVR